MGRNLIVILQPDFPGLLRNKKKVSLGGAPICRSAARRAPASSLPTVARCRRLGLRRSLGRERLGRLLAVPDLLDEADDLGLPLVQLLDARRLLVLSPLDDLHLL